MREIKILAMMELLKFCDRPVTKANMNYINNDFFWVMSAQLYRSYVKNEKSLYLNDEQIKFVQLCVDRKWNGTKTHFDGLMEVL